MIRLNCTNCQTELQIDDAFAGGVCRCQHCGTIQTVSAQADTTGATVSQGGGKGSKSLYQRKGKSEPMLGSGLDQLADIVASSGLSGSGLTSGRLRKPPPGSKPAPKQKLIAGLPVPIAAGGGAVILVLLILVIWLATRGGDTPNNPDQNSGPNIANTTGNPSPDTPTRATAGPVFVKAKLNESSVIYVLDRGGGTKEYFSALKEATLQSAISLGSERKFQIVFWSLESTPPLACPTGNMAFATTENVDSCRRALEEITASGASDPASALKLAFSKSPAALVIATGKGWGLDEAFVKSVLDARGAATTKVYTFALGGSATSTAMKDVARQTGGQHFDVTESELRAATR